MAIAYDTVAANRGTSSPITYTHPCTGTNLLLIAYVASANDTSTGVTYNGVSMTLIGKTSYTGGSRYGIAMYYLLNPATGSNTVSASFSAGGGVVYSLSYTGVAQSGQPDAHVINNQDTLSTSITLTVNVVAANCWLMGSEYDGNGGESAGAGTTIRSQNGTENGTFFDSNGTVGTGNQSLVINYSLGTNNAGIAASFKTATTAPASNASFLTNFI